MSQKLLIAVQDDPPNRAWLVDWLSARFPIEWVPQEDYLQADYLLCGDFGYNHENFGGVKIYFTGENHAANLNDYDYCFTHEFIEDERRHRFPYWQYSTLVTPCTPETSAYELPPITAEELVAEQRDFCAFICRNAICRKRNNFVKHLNAIRKVNCAGPFMNNVGFLLPKGAQAKLEYQHKHLFSVAYENEATPGYQTEKIMDGFMSRSIPIYWGNPRVEDEFNPEAFVHARRFPSEKALIRHILELAEDPVRMAAMISAPHYRDPQVLEKAEQGVVDFLSRIFERGPGAIRRSRMQQTKAVLSRFYGHGFFRTFRRVSRHLRGKGGDQGLGSIIGSAKKQKG